MTVANEGREYDFDRWLGQSLSDAPERFTGASPGRSVFKRITAPFGQALPQPPFTETTG